MIEPIIGMIHNVQKSTFHPVLFLAHPLGDVTEGVTRYKSKMHDTEGYASRDEAIASVPELASEVEKSDLTAWMGKPKLALDADFPWDGEGIPAMVVFFGEFNGKVVPVI